MYDREMEAASEKAELSPEDNRAKVTSPVAAKRTTRRKKMEEKIAKKKLRQ